MTALRTTLFLILFSLPAGAATLHVSESGDGTTGANWSEAYRTIGDAMVSSASGDHLWVAAGTYNENVVLVTGVHLYGGFSGDESLDEFALRDFRINETIIDATGTGLNAVVIYGDCILDGFTVTGGGGSEEHLSLATGGVMGMGSNSTSVIRHCLIHHNRNFGINSFDGTINRNGVLHNINAVGIANGNGLIEDNEIGHNAPNGGMHNCLGTIRRNLIHDNNSANGAGVSSCGVVENNVIYSNVALDSTIFGTEGRGGGVSSVRILRYNTIVFNQAYASYGGFSGSGGVYYGNIIWGNTLIESQILNDPIVQVNNPGDHSYSCIQGIDRENGNFPENPLFVDPENNDFRLRMNSPCIDSASTSGPSQDLDGNPRPVDIRGTGREGPGAFDMGAFEFQVPRSDLNSDGYVNEMDLMIFQRDWMKVSGP